LFLRKLDLYIIWIRTKPCITPVKGMYSYIDTNMLTIIHISVTVEYCWYSFLLYTSWRLECAVSKWSHKTKKHKIPQQNRRTCKRTNSTVTRTT
jgi:hypothetical protein